MLHQAFVPQAWRASRSRRTPQAECGILKQLRDGEFEQQLQERLVLEKQDRRNALELVQAAGELQKAATAKEAEIR
ncbi:hypothetical protein D3C87_1009220 [compost metagenome]